LNNTLATFKVTDVKHQLHFAIEDLARSQTAQENHQFWHQEREQERSKPVLQMEQEHLWTSSSGVGSSCMSLLSTHTLLPLTPARQNTFYEANISLLSNIKTQHFS